MVQLRDIDRPGSEAMYELPMAGERRERGDAAANRQRILCAARKLLAEQGVEGLTMQAVAAEAGVGKGTVFRRFGDRDGLTQALVDEYMRDFQDAFLRGPPPLGPGAPPEQRLEAFIDELVQRQTDNLHLAVAAETPPGQAQPPVYAALLLHIATLVHQINPDVDERIVASYILSAISAPVLRRMLAEPDVDTAALRAAARALLHGLTRPAADRDACRDKSLGTRRENRPSGHS